jgi:hypothetical protein
MSKNNVPDGLCKYGVIAGGKFLVMCVTYWWLALAGGAQRGLDVCGESGNQKWLAAAKGRGRGKLPFTAAFFG